ncbi:hypothetical protein PVK64_20130 [Aliivibrio sp. S4TY2]|nr:MULTISPECIES: hypothetical protein [unclassified Aliivibrio]MDD9158475.1 hypothetical protein [Aliivibrio sp. S4TY2]MDD9162474.1 hypothetical protein [Aliivibrio sp. S4TY1]MDD9170471.1 hypothetical protein [Aliivibrio sp. S4MY4]MDD9187553.1 hypothetical protein [Aliivibrio sp. S4MY3]
MIDIMQIDILEFRNAYIDLSNENVSLRRRLSGSPERFINKMLEMTFEHECSYEFVLTKFERTYIQRIKFQHVPISVGVLRGTGTQTKSEITLLGVDIESNQILSNDYIKKLVLDILIRGKGFAPKSWNPEHVKNMPEKIISVSKILT